MHQRTSLAAAATRPAVAAALLADPGSPSAARPWPPPAPTSAAAPPPRSPPPIGKGGAISTVDPEASAAGLKVLAPAATPSTPRSRPPPPSA